MHSSACMLDTFELHCLKVKNSSMGVKVFECSVPANPNRCSPETCNHTRVCNRHHCSLSPALQTCAGAAVEEQCSLRTPAKGTITTAVPVLKLLCKHTNRQFYKPDLYL